MLTACLVIAFILAFWGCMITEDTAPSLLSGYNTMSDEKKKNVNFKGVAKIYNIVFYSIAGALVIIGILSYFFENDNLWAALLPLVVLWGLIPLFFLGKKYDTNTYPKWQYAINYIVLAFLFFGGIFIAIEMYTHEGSLLIN